MAYQEVTRVEIQEIIRRWQAGEGYRRVASGTGLSRNTVRKYLSAAKAEGIARDGTVPTGSVLFGMMACYRWRHRSACYATRRYKIVDETWAKGVNFPFCFHQRAP